MTSLSMCAFNSHPNISPGTNENYDRKIKTTHDVLYVLKFFLKMRFPFAHSASVFVFLCSNLVALAQASYTIADQLLRLWHSI